MIIKTQEDLLKRLEELYERNVEIVYKKNSDYANTDDPFFNFKVCASLGIPVEIGFIVRMIDKVSRVKNLIDRDAKVSDESMLDSLSDLANYAMLFRMYIETKNGNTSDIEVEYKGRKIKCHPDSWLAKFGKPIQDFTDEELRTIMTNEFIYPPKTVS